MVESGISACSGRDQGVMNALMKRYAFTMMIALVGCLTSCAEDEKKAEAKPELKDIRIELETSKGKIEATIYASKVPVTAANFLNLAKRGYYDGLKFHRVIPNFMIQGGDPDGTGRGGPGYRFQDETRKDLKHDRPGIFSMANADPRHKQAYSNTGRTNGSQIFITHVATPHLDGKHTVFGAVTKGQDVVNSIDIGDTIKSIHIVDPTDKLFAAQKSNIEAWNKVLDARKK